MLSKIVTYNLNTKEIVSEMYACLLDEGKQDWLFKHIIWANTNENGVQISNNEANDGPEDREKQAAYELSRKAWREAHGVNNQIGVRGTKTKKAETF